MSKGIIIARVLRWADAMLGMKYSRTYRYDWYKQGRTDCSGYVFAMWLAGLFPLEGIQSMTSMYEVYAKGFDLKFPQSYDRIGKDWAPKGLYKSFAWEPGDIIFYNFDSTTTRSNKITHVACCYDSKHIIHTANTRENACKKAISYGDGKILAVIRLQDDVKAWALPDTTASAATKTVTRILQVWLNYHGAGLRCDGDWGSKTTAAVEKFKADAGLGTDGTRVDARVWSALIDDEDAVKGDDKVIKKGAKSESVRAWQNALLAAGQKLPKYGADADFGSETENATREFQKASGLPQTGIVDAATAAAMWSALRAKSGDESKVAVLEAKIVAAQKALA